MLAPVGTIPAKQSVRPRIQSSAHVNFQPQANLRPDCRAGHAQHRRSGPRHRSPPGDGDTNGAGKEILAEIIQPNSTAREGRFEAANGGTLFLSALVRHDWPGNVRELRNCIRRACLLAPSMRIAAPDLMLTGSGGNGAPEVPPAREPDRDEIEGALTRHEGVIAKAARDLGLSRQSLYRRMEKLGIAPGSPDGR
jgi:transcriptional regulator of acetoin/glycerol metabolism